MKVWLVLCLLCTQAYFGLTQNEKEDLIRTIFGLTDPSEVCGPNQKCVPRAECLKSALVAGGEHLIDIRFGSDNCGHDNFVCCNTNDMKPPACGIRNKEGVGCAINGGPFDTNFGEFPWMIAILSIVHLPERRQILFKCGGSLIAKNVVLTTTQFLKDQGPGKLVARAGEWNYSIKDEAIPHQDRNVKEIVSHEKFDLEGLHNIALIIVDEPFIYGQTVRPICLSNGNQNFDFESCYVTGWGQLKNGTHPAILKKIDQPIIPKQICRANFREGALQNYLDIDGSLICAGGVERQVMSRTELGGPLVCPIDKKANQYSQVGVLSGILLSLTKNLANFYADVAHFRPWIDGQLLSRNIDVSEYIF